MLDKWRVKAIARFTELRPDVVTPASGMGRELELASARRHCSGLWRLHASRACSSQCASDQPCTVVLVGAPSCPLTTDAAGSPTNLTRGAADRIGFEPGRVRCGRAAALIPDPRIYPAWIGARRGALMASDAGPRGIFGVGPKPRVCFASTSEYTLRKYAKRAYNAKASGNSLASKATSLLVDDVGRAHARRGPARRCADGRRRSGWGDNSDTCHSTLRMWSSTSEAARP